MIIYNVTTNVQEDIQEQWLEWMKQEHIPEMLATGKFVKALMTRVLVKETMGGITYSTQFTAENKEKLQEFYREDAARLESRSKAFEGKFVVFTTELEVVSEQ